MSFPVVISFPDKDFSKIASASDKSGVNIREFVRSAAIEKASTVINQKH